MKNRIIEILLFTFALITLCSVIIDLFEIKKIFGLTFLSLTGFLLLLYLQNMYINAKENNGILLLIAFFCAFIGFMQIIINVM